MPIKITFDKWREETNHGRIILRISEKGLFVRRITDLGDGHPITYDEKQVSFQDVLDLAEGQKHL